MPLGMPFLMMFSISGRARARSRLLSTSDEARPPAPRSPWHDEHTLWKTAAPSAIGSGVCAAGGSIDSSADIATKNRTRIRARILLIEAECVHDRLSRCHIHAAVGNGDAAE